MNSSRETRGQFPIDNLTYDLITIIHEKSTGLEAYDRYLQDAQGNQQLSQLLQQIRQQDTQHIQQLTPQLQQVLSSSAVGAGSSSSS